MIPVTPTTDFPAGKKYYRLPDHENRVDRFDEQNAFYAHNRALGVQTVNAVTHTVPSSTDPLGMYTGIPENPNDLPVQDADDL